LPQLQYLRTEERTRFFELAADDIRILRNVLSLVVTGILIAELRRIGRQACITFQNIRIQIETGFKAADLVAQMTAAFLQLD
jgi:hypothetical protein